MKKILLYLLMSTPLIFLGQSYEGGEQVFTVNCAACHRMDEVLVGPKLNNVINLQGEEWTRKWIGNNVELRESGDKHAKDVYEQYNKQAMPVYEGMLDDAEMDDLIVYLTEWDDKQAELAKVEEPEVITSNGDVTEIQVTIERTVKIIIALCFVALSLGLIFVYKSFSLMSNMYFKGRILQTYLLRKLDMTSDEAETELNDYIKDMVDNDINIKKKELKKIFNERIDNIEIEKKEENSWIKWISER